MTFSSDLGPLTTVGNLVSAKLWIDSPMRILNPTSSHSGDFASRSVLILRAEKVSAHDAAYFSARLTEQLVGLATSFLSGSKEEWSLVRRHPSESMFGVQVAGSKPGTLVSTAEVIAKECNGIDFMDLNCGCPIDLVFRTGSGSARTSFQHRR
jgi:tRNA-dihydrouridine synthase